MNWKKMTLKEVLEKVQNKPIGEISKVISKCYGLWMVFVFFMMIVVVFGMDLYFKNKHREWQMAVVKMQEGFFSKIDAESREEHRKFQEVFDAHDLYFDAKPQYAEDAAHEK